MSTDPICTCAACRRGIRDRIADVFRRHRHWLGYWTIVSMGDLGWVPKPLYREILGDMIERGILLSIQDPEAPFGVYMLSSLVASPLRKRASKQGKRGKA
jgi:hypothetical protein